MHVRKDNRMIPKDPVMLLSFINMRLRDYGIRFDALCEDLGVERSEVEATLATIDYYYNEEQNRFV